MYCKCVVEVGLATEAGPGAVCTRARAVGADAVGPAEDGRLTGVVADTWSCSCGCNEAVVDTCSCSK